MNDNANSSFLVGLAFAGRFSRSTEKEGERWHAKCFCIKMFVIGLPFLKHLLQVLDFLVDASSALLHSVRAEV